MEYVDTKIKHYLNVLLIIVGGSWVDRHFELKVTFLWIWMITSIKIRHRWLLENLSPKSLRIFLFLYFAQL